MTKWKLLGFSLLGLGLVVSYWMYLRSRDPEVVARDLAQSFIDRNPDGIFSFRSADEERLTGITQDKFRKIWFEIVEPEISKTRVGLEVKSSRLNDPPTQGAASVDLTLPDGTVFGWPITAWVTETKPKAQTLANTLNATWLLRYALEHPAEYRAGMNFAHAKLQGLRRDRQFLEGLGVSGMIAESGAYLEWSQYERHWTSQIARQKQTTRSR